MSGKLSCLEPIRNLISSEFDVIFKNNIFCPAVVMVKIFASRT